METLKFLKLLKLKHILQFRQEGKKFLINYQMQKKDFLLEAKFPMKIRSFSKPLAKLEFHNSDFLMMRGIEVYMAYLYQKLKEERV